MSRRTLASLDHVYTSVGARIRDERRRLHMSSDELGQLVNGRDGAYVRSIELGKRGLSLARLVEFADVLGVRVADLVEGL